MYRVFVASAWITIPTVIRVETDATLNARFAGFMYILDAGMNLLMASYIREAGYIHAHARALINVRSSSLVTSEINLIRNLYYR